LALEYSRFCAQNPHLRRTWATFGRHKLQDAMLQRQGTLHHYIRDRARIKQKMDSCLQLPLPQATLALKWRCNKLFLNKKCSDCKKPFNRSHLATCNVMPTKFISISKDKDYQQDLDEIFKELTDKGSNEIPDFFYTPLDFLLNERRYDEFKELIDHIDALMNPQTNADSS
jgi:hypothetical protein